MLLILTGYGTGINKDELGVLVYLIGFVSACSGIILLNQTHL